MGLLFAVGVCGFASIYAALGRQRMRLADKGSDVTEGAFNNTILKGALEMLCSLKRTITIRFPFLGAFEFGRHNSERMVLCEREMPEFLDVVALGLSAGLSFDASLELYCQRSSSPLSREFQHAMQYWRMGIKSRARALSDMSLSIGARSLSKFCHAVCESLSFGVPLAQTLEHQSDLLREEQRAQIQERIEEVPVRMLIPLGLLVVPAMLLAILGPLLSASLAN